MEKFFYYLLLISAILGYSLSLPFFSDIYLFHIIFAILLFLFFVGLLLSGKIKIEIKNIKNYLLFFLIWFSWILLSFFWVEDLFLASKFTLIYFLMFLFAIFLIIYNKDKETFKKTLKVLFFISLFALLIGTIEAFTPLRLPVSPYSSVARYDLRVGKYLETVPTSFFYNPNNYATFLSFFLPFTLFGINFANGKKKKIIFLLISILIGINIIMSGSNLNIIALIFILFVYFWLSWLRKKSFKSILKYALIILLALSVFSFILKTNAFLSSRFNQTTGYINKATSRQFSSRGGDSFSTRFTIIKKIIYPPSALDFFRGFGIGNSREYLRKQEIPNDITDPHGWWLEILGDFGFFFFLLYLFFFISILIKLWKIIKKPKEKFSLFLSNSCFLALFGFIISSMSPSTIAYFIPQWILISIAIITINLFSKRHENSLSS
ncbi:MAG: O-antigen ligase family protein [Candidatus Pacebacteria bacterium]|nr:O-antigen ligase family protein [Candidatus Paceibacterota bacterium]